MLLGSCDPDVTEPALLFEFLRVAERSHVRKDPVLEAREEHGGILEALGIVECHQGDLVGVLNRIGGCYETDRLQEHLDLPDPVKCVPIIWAHGCGPRFLELGGSTEEFLEVVLSSHRLDRLLRADHVEVTRVVKHRVKASMGSSCRAFGQHVDQRGELEHRFLSPRCELIDFVRSLQRFKEPDGVGFSETVDVRDRCVPDGTTRDVDDPLDRDLVIGVHDGPEIGEGVLDLFAVVVLESPDNLIGDTEADEQFLDNTGLGVGPVEHSNVVKTDSPVLESSDLLGNEGSFLVLVLGFEDRDLVPGTFVGPQALWLASRVVGDHSVRGVEDRLCGPVVLIEDDDPCIGIVLFEVHDVAQVRTAERVDRLVGVTDDTHVPVLLGE